MTHVSIQRGKRQRIIRDALPGMAGLAARHRYVVRRKLVCGLWEPEDWRWSVIHVRTKGIITQESGGDWTYDEALSIAKDMGDGWIVTPTTPIENEWGTLHSRLRELGWSIRCTWGKQTLDIEIWKAGKIHRWSGSPDQTDSGFRDIALLVVEGDRGVESTEKKAPGLRRKI